jgi:hypothetical protein
MQSIDDGTDINAFPGRLVLEAMHLDIRWLATIKAFFDLELVLVLPTAIVAYIMSTHSKYQAEVVMRAFVSAQHALAQVHNLFPCDPVLAGYVE